VVLLTEVNETRPLVWGRDKILKNMSAKTNYTVAEVAAARRYWSGLTYQDLLFFWRHYTTGTGAGMYQSVYPDTSFLDYIVESAIQSEYERTHDI
jgi:hypothetical protein